MNYEKYMKYAIELAKKGEGKVNPNPMVGAVIVKDGEIIGEGYHKYYGGPHAEIYALEEAGAKAEGADIYVTLEPCSHYGKTPPCVEAIIKYKIKRCIIAMIDPNPLVSGRGIQKLKESGIEVIEGILEKESIEINSVFIKYIKTKIPYIFLKTAITLDGKIASRTGDSKWISNEKARQKVQELRNKYSAIMVGINTVIKDNPSLTARIENGKNPYRIVIDPDLKIEYNFNIIKLNSDKKTIIVTSKENEETEKHKYLLKQDVEFIFLEGRYFKIKDIIFEVGKRKIDSILIEGGSSLITDAIKEKIIDSGIFFISPKIIGDENAISFAKNINIEKMNEAIKLKNPEFEIFDDNIALKFEGIV